MSRFFGKGKAPAAATAPAAAPSTPTPHPAQAVETMSETREMLDKREAHLQRLVDKEIETARMYTTAGKQKLAIDCIKRKRLHESEMERISVQRMNLMQSEEKLKSLRITTIVLDAEARGVAAIEHEMRKMGGVEGAEKLQDRLEDALADTTDVLDASARLVGEVASLDDHDLLDELEAMELADELKTTRIQPAPDRAQVTDVSDTGVSASMFAQVPQSVPTVAERRKAEREAAEARELAELRAGMQMEQGMPLPMMAAAY